MFEPPLSNEVNRLEQTMNICPILLVFSASPIVFVGAYSKSPTVKKKN
jgi:hypothetical protein